MNYVDIIGGRKDQRELAEKVINIMLHELGLGRTRALDIEFKITRGLYKNTGAEAFYTGGETRLDHHIEIEASLGLRDFITAICHEMTHLKQAYRKELFEDAKGRQFWKGKDYTDANYIDQPWEIEAYAMQDELALKVWEEL